MKHISMTLSAFLFAACGGSGPGPSEPQPQFPDTVAENEPSDDSLAMVPEETMPTPTPESESVIAPAGGEIEAPVPAMAQEPAPAVITASAALANVKSGDAMGKVMFSRANDGVITITGEFTGLKKNAQHAFYIHEYGDCSKGGKRVGGHLDPTNAKHGPPSSAERHAGDFGNLATDDTGNAVFEMTTDSLTLEPGRGDSIIGRAIVIHAKKDDAKGKKAGAALACGVIDFD